MRLPDFLIIGAMKSGTTSLYRDLCVNPRVFMPVDKETNALADAGGEGLEAYAAHFADASSDQICGEASTSYTKIPTYTGVAERARRVLGEGVKLVYVVREPVSRTLSHHYHAFSWGETHGDVNTAVREDATFIDYSRYAYQLEPWLEHFPRDQIMVVQFERYTADRRTVVAEISRFLGLEPKTDGIRQDVVHNKGDRRPIHKGALTTVNQSFIYRRVLRHVIRPAFRQFLYRTVFPKAPERPPAPTLETIDFMIDRLRDDVVALQRITGDAEPFWDLDTIRRRYEVPIEASKSTPVADPRAPRQEAVS